MAMAKATRPTLIDVLLKKGLLGKKDAEKARENHRSNGENFTDTLVEMGLITREEVAKALADELQIPYIDLTSYELDPKAMEALPEGMVRKYRVVPLSLSGGVLTLATSDPLNVVTIDYIRATTDLQIRTVVSPSGQIEDAISDFCSVKATKNLEEVIKHTEKEAEEIEVVKGREEVDLDQLIKQTQD
ncbi:unnamed protein product, partial [marine sediment metagenome]